MKKLFLILNSAFLIHNFSFAQPSIQWQKSLGGTAEDRAYSIQQTTDGGFVVAGYTYSNDGDVTGNHGYDYWVVKLDTNGNIQWQKCLGGSGLEKSNSIQQTGDGGYIVAGFTNGNDGDVTGQHGAADYWLVKLDNSGTIQWQKCLGGTSGDFATSVQQTTDGGYIVAGYTSSNDGDVTGYHGYYDYWLVKINSSGNIQWQKCLGGTGLDWATSVQQTTNGGYIVGGYTDSNDGDVVGNHGIFDYWVVKLYGSGNIQWQKCLGGTNEDVANSVAQTTDGGYIVAGNTKSNDGDVTGNHDTWGNYDDQWVVKLDSGGIIQWQKCLGGTFGDGAWSIQQTADGGFIVAGWAASIDGDVTGNHDITGQHRDYWIVKLNSSGNIQWQKCLGGTAEDWLTSVAHTADGGYIVGGYTSCTDGDVTGNHGGEDFWVVKLSPYVGIEEESNKGAYNISPNPFTTQAVISFSSPVYNATFSLYNLLGEKVIGAADINGESFQFNRGNLPSGVYVFEVREKNKNIARGKAVVY
jgi:hypothetical protein